LLLKPQQGGIYGAFVQLQHLLTQLLDATGNPESGRTAAGTLWRKVIANLVVIELATTMVLPVGAGLLGKSFYRLLHVDPWPATG
jgi:hypothetical protein